MTFFLFIGLIFFLAGFIQGMSGFGSALVALPLLTLMLDIKDAIPLCVLVSLVITIHMALGLKKHFHRKKIQPLVIGAIPGVIAGSTLLKMVPSHIIRISLGSFLICYAMYNLVFSPVSKRLSNKWGYLAGFLSGSIGAAFSAGGPPAIIYASINSWSKDEIKATLTGFFLFNSVIVAIAHAVSGLTTMPLVLDFLFAVPFVIVGTKIGTFCYSHIQQEVYLKIIFLSLIFMGIMTIIH